VRGGVRGPGLHGGALRQTRTTGRTRRRRPGRGHRRAQRPAGGRRSTRRDRIRGRALEGGRGKTPPAVLHLGRREPASEPLGCAEARLPRPCIDRVPQRRWGAAARLVAAASDAGHHILMARLKLPRAKALPPLAAGPPTFRGLWAARLVRHSGEELLEVEERHRGPLHLQQRTDAASVGWRVSAGTRAIQQAVAGWRGARLDLGAAERGTSPGLDRRAKLRACSALRAI
jgi:hypothetical protein